MVMESISEKKKRVVKIYKILQKEYPDAHCTLGNHSHDQFLFANILSSQCTDQIASRVSKDLMKKFGGAEGVAKASLKQIADVIRPAGFFNVKSKYIKKSAQLLITEYDGILPRTLDNLMKFPGIARKLGLVILGEVYNKVEGIVIDTHNIRLAKRIGLVSPRTKSADKIEKPLLKLLPRSKWRMWSHYMVYHGRAVCVARKPRCEGCVINELCRYNLGRTQL